MASLERLRTAMTVQGYTLEAVAKNAESVEELRRGVRDVLSQIEAELWRLEQGEAGAVF